MTSLGIDIGGTSVKVAARDGEGKLLWTGQSPFYKRPDTETLLQSIRAAIAGRLDHASAVGICVPGLLDRPRRTITAAVNVPGLVEIPLDVIIERALGSRPEKPAEILNDAVSSGHDLYNSRRAKGRLLVMALGTGVGAAVLDDGVPLFVEGASPGHLGQLDVSVPGHPVVGPDGGAGGLEGYIGANVLAEKYGDVAETLKKFRGDEPEIRALAHAIRIAHAIYRPHHIIISGGLGTRMGHLLPALRARVEDRLTSIAQPGWTLTTGDSDFHAAQGASSIALRK
jgi:glucokinase